MKWNQGIQRILGLAAIAALLPLCGAMASPAAGAAATAKMVPNVVFICVDDPHDWTNLADKPEYSEIVSMHRQWLPKTNLPPVAGSKSRVLTYDPQTDEAIWQGRAKKIRRTDPVPQ